MSQFLLFIETMPISLNIVQLHTKDKYEGIPVTVHIRHNGLINKRPDFQLMI